MGARAVSPGLVLDSDFMFATIEDWLAMTGRASPEVEAGSPLTGDARWSPELQVAHAAWSAVTQAIDHLHAVKTLVADARVVHTHAPFTLLRSATENAATAVWLLEPGSRTERVRRRLKLAYHEAKESGNAHKLMAAEVSADKRSAEERITEIQTLATEHSIDPNDLAGRFSYGVVVRQAGAATELGGNLALLLWQMCSGFAHGHYWASLSFLNRQEVPRAGEAGVFNVRLTNDVDRVLTITQVPFVLTIRALQLYELRRRSPFGVA
jgi:hypothetical protein